MLGFPAGFKPNVNLAHFIGNYALELILAWRHFASLLIVLHKPIIIGTSLFGSLGFSVFLAILHDILFVYSAYIFFMYSVFANIHRQLLNLARTL